MYISWRNLQASVLESLVNTEAFENVQNTGSLYFTSLLHTTELNCPFQHPMQYAIIIN